MGQAALDAPWQWSLAPPSPAVSRSGKSSSSLSESAKLARRSASRSARTLATTFQRDAIIALHDALAAYWQTILASYRQIHRLTEAERETVDSDALFVPVRADYWRMTAARAKVFDDELCGLVKAVSDLIDVAIQLGRRASPSPRSLEGELRPDGADRGPCHHPAQTAVLTCSWAEHQSGDGRGGLFLERGSDVLVGVGGERARGVAEPLAHHLDRDAGGQPQRGVGVPEVVEADAGQARLLDPPLERV